MLHVTLAKTLASMEKWFDGAGPWLGAIFLVGAIHALANYAASIHWIVEFGITVLFAVFGLALLIGWRRRIYVAKYPISQLFGMWLCTVILFVEVFASSSAALAAFQPGAFQGPATANRAVFVDFYAYHFVDAIPGVKVWDSFAVAPFPYRQSTFAAGLLLLLFRSVILAILIGALKDWITSTNVISESTRAT